MHQLLYKKFDDQEDWRTYSIYEIDNLEIAIDALILLKDGFLIKLERIKP